MAQGTRIARRFSSVVAGLALALGLGSAGCLDFEEPEDGTAELEPIRPGYEAPTRTEVEPPEDPDNRRPGLIAPEDTAYQPGRAYRPSVVTNEMAPEDRDGSGQSNAERNVETYDRPQANLVSPEDRYEPGDSNLERPVERYDRPETDLVDPDDPVDDVDERMAPVD